MFTFEITKDLKPSKYTQAKVSIAEAWSVSLNDCMPAEYVDYARKHGKLKQVKLEVCGARVDQVIPSSCSAFITAWTIAFNEHRPIAMSPDDVWLCIATGLARHIESNPEKYRKQFVQHEGQLNLVVQRDNFVKGGQNDWLGAFDEFSAQIKEHIGKKHDLIVGNFTTTGPAEKAASEIVLMDVVRAYMTYEMRTMCGVPKLTLLGEVADWKNIRQRVEMLAEFDLGWWTEALLPVCDQLIRTAEGQPDVEWWESFYKYDGGSGGPTVTGHVNALFPYLKKEDGYERNYAMPQHCGEFNTGNYPRCVSCVPFVWNYYGKLISMEFIGGFVGVAFDENGPHGRRGEVLPAIGWAVREAKVR